MKSIKIVDITEKHPEGYSLDKHAAMLVIQTSVESGYAPRVIEEIRVENVDFKITDIVHSISEIIVFVECTE